MLVHRRVVCCYRSLINYILSILISVMMDDPGEKSIVGNGPKVSALDGQAPESTGKFLVLNLFESSVQCNIEVFYDI